MHKTHGTGLCSSIDPINFSTSIFLMYMDEAVTVQIHVHACMVEKENSLHPVSIYPRV